MKAQLEDIVRKELNLPDNAVITRASFQITDKDDEVRIIGSTAVEYQDKDQEDVSSVILDAPDPRTRRGRKAKKESEPKTPPLRRAKEGEGKNITDAQIKGWRITLGVRQKMGQLTKEQIAALDATKGKHASSLLPEQRQQIKDIVDETAPARF